MKRRSFVLTMSTHERLAEMRRQIDELEANARPGTAGAQPRIQRQLDALRRQEAAAMWSPSAEKTRSRRSSRSSRRGSASRGVLSPPILQRARARSRTPSTTSWRRGPLRRAATAQVALRAATARAQAEAEISEVRRRRNDVAAQLADVRAVNGGAWDQLRGQVADARDRLEQTADQVSARFK